MTRFAAIEQVRAALENYYGEHEPLSSELGGRALAALALLQETLEAAEAYADENWGWRDSAKDQELADEIVRNYGAGVLRFCQALDRVRAGAGEGAA